MRTVIEIKSETACGCIGSVAKGIGSVRGVYGARVDPRSGRVVVDHTDETDPEALAVRLREMGYEVSVSPGTIIENNQS